LRKIKNRRICRGIRKVKIRKIQNQENKNLEKNKSGKVKFEKNLLEKDKIWKRNKNLDMLFSLSVSFGKLQRNSYLYDLCSLYLTEAKATDRYISSLITRYCSLSLSWWHFTTLLLLMTTACLDREVPIISHLDPSCSPSPSSHPATHRKFEHALHQQRHWSCRASRRTLTTSGLKEINFLSDSL
jgi:hypothetical protein